MSFDSHHNIDTQFATSGCKVSDPSTGAVIAPIHLSTTYERDQETLELISTFNYSRLSNPTRLQFEQSMVELERGWEGYAFSSGMQAITSLLLSMPKVYVLIPEDLYHGVSVIIKEVFQPWGMQFEQVNMTNHDRVTQVLQRLAPLQTQVLIWLETPSNPLCQVLDIAGICQLAKSILDESLVTIAVDATWSTPYLLQPLTLGADIVIHSVTKYIGGHSDMLGGILVTGHSIAAKRIAPSLKLSHEIGGGVLGPWESYMATRGLRTLHIRMKAHCASALSLAQYLEQHDGVEYVYYPGLISHPQHSLSQRQMKGLYGGMLSFRVKSKETGSSIEALQVLRAVKLFKRATSLGGTESLIEHRATVEGEHGTSPKNLLRVSVGLEDIDDLTADLDQALKSVL